MVLWLWLSFSLKLKMFFRLEKPMFLSNSKHRALLMNQFISVKLCASARVIERKKLKKFPFYFAFCSVCTARLCRFVPLGQRTFDLRSKVLSLERKKKNVFLFCSLLTYSYLCRKVLEYGNNDFTSAVAGYCG